MKTRATSKHESSGGCQTRFKFSRRSRIQRATDSSDGPDAGCDPQSPDCPFDWPHCANVSTIVSELKRKACFAVKTSKGQSGSAFGALEINPDGALSIGVHIGRRSTEMILTNLTGQIIVRTQEVYTHPDPHAIAAFVGKTRKAFARRQV